MRKEKLIMEKSLNLINQKWAVSAGAEVKKCAFLFAMQFEIWFDPR